MTTVFQQQQQHQQQQQPTQQHFYPPHQQHTQQTHHQPQQQQGQQQQYYYGNNNQQYPDAPMQNAAYQHYPGVVPSANQNHQQQLQTQQMPQEHLEQAYLYQQQQLQRQPAPQSQYGHNPAGPVGYGGLQMSPEGYPSAQHQLQYHQQFQQHQLQQQPQQQFQQQSIHQQVVTSSDATRIDWKPSESDLAQLDKWFYQLDTEGKGLLQGAQAVGFLTNSNLSWDTLRTIWSIVDVNGSGHIDLRQFYKTIRLVSISCSPTYAGSNPSMEKYYSTVTLNIPLPSMIKSENNMNENSHAVASPMVSTTAGQISHNINQIPHSGQMQAAQGQGPVQILQGQGQGPAQIPQGQGQGPAQIPQGQGQGHFQIPQGKQGIDDTMNMSVHNISTSMISTSLEKTEIITTDDDFDFSDFKSAAPIIVPNSIVFDNNAIPASISLSSFPTNISQPNLAEVEGQISGKEVVINNVMRGSEQVIEEQQTIEKFRKTGSNDMMFASSNN